MVAASGLELRRRRQRWSAIIAAIMVLALFGGGLAAVWRGNQPHAAVNAADQETAPPPALAANRTWQVVLHTNAGDIGLELYGDRAPQAVASFVALAQQNFFTDSPCHRLTTANIFVLQCGDPTGTGSGGPGYTFGPIENAPADNFYPAGTLAMARRGNDPYSMGSQFFLVYADSTIGSDAAGGYTVFGRITSGLDLLQAIAAAGVADGSGDGRPALDVTIEGVEVR